MTGGLLPPVLIELKAITGEFAAQMKESKAEVREVGEASEESSAKTSKAGAVSKAAFLGVAGAAVAFSALSVKSAMEYQSSMAKVQGAAGLTSQQTKSLGSTFTDTMGKSTFSAQEMATAMGPVAAVVKNLAGGSLTNAAAMKFMNAAMDESEATGQSLNSTTSDLSAVMQAYGLNINDADEASNTLFNTSRLTGVGLDTLTTTVDKMKTKLGTAAPSLNDTSALMEDLATHGVTGSRGIQTVSSGLTTLLGSSKSTTAELKTLGVNVYNSKGQFVGMGSVISQLSPKLQGMTQQQQLAAATALFGKGAAASLTSTLLAGSSAYDKSTAAVTKSNAVQDAAKAQATTLHGQLHTLAATAEDLATKWGMVLIPALSKFVGYVGTAVTAVMKDISSWFQRNRKSIETVAHVVGGVLVDAFHAAIAVLTNAEHVIASVVGWLDKHRSVAMLLLGVVGGMVAAWAAWTIAMTIWSAATAAATMVQAAFDAVMDANPIMLVVVALGALAAGVYEAYEHFGPFRTVVDDIGKALKTVWTGVLQPVVGFFEKNWKTALAIAVAVFLPFVALPLVIVKYWGSITGFFTKLWGDVEKIFTTIVSNVVAVVKGWYPVILGVLSGGILLIPALIFKYWSQIKTFVANAFTSAINWIEGVPGKILAIFSGAASWLLTVGKNVATGLWNGFVNGLKVMWTFLGTIGNTIDSWFADAGTWLINAGENIIHGLVKGITNVAGDVGGAIKGAINHIPGLGSALGHIGLAEGGVVTQPTFALIGEGGEPEYVIPQSKLGKANANGVKTLPDITASGQVNGTVAPATLPATSGGGGVTIQVNGDLLDLQGLFKALGSDPHAFMALLQAATGQFGGSNTSALPTTLYRQR